jgi:hypothetical protein
MCTYDRIPPPLRVQIVHIVRDALGNVNQDQNGNVQTAYESIVDLLCREYGVFKLSEGQFTARYRDYSEELLTFILQETDVEKVIDAVEVCFQYVDRIVRQFGYQFVNDSGDRADAAISELNQRFAEHGIGYRFEGAEVIRVDSELIHAGVVKPALGLLSDRKFSGAQDEFLVAHEHYRSRRYKEALTDSLKALESVMKTICKKRNWSYKATATASDLIDVCFTNGLIPAFWQSHFSSLRSMLESSIPTGRNKLSAHGQGAEIKVVPQHIAGYVLHMTAATMVFLVEADKSLT